MDESYDHALYVVWDHEWYVKYPCVIKRQIYLRRIRQ